MKHTVKLSENMEFIILRDKKSGELLGKMGEVERVDNSANAKLNSRAVVYSLVINRTKKQNLKQREYNAILEFNNISDEVKKEAPKEVKPEAPVVSEDKSPEEIKIEALKAMDKKELFVKAKSLYAEGTNTR